jgi:hypothetical protein
MKVSSLRPLIFFSILLHEMEKMKLVFNQFASNSRYKWLNQILPKVLKIKGLAGSYRDL